MCIHPAVVFSGLICWQKGLEINRIVNLPVSAAGACLLYPLYGIIDENELS
jgi:hypothetical protein